MPLALSVRKTSGFVVWLGFQVVRRGGGALNVGVERSGWSPTTWPVIEMLFGVLLVAFFRLSDVPMCVKW